MSDTHLKSTSLGNQLIFWFLLLALLPLVVVSWISYQQANSSLTKAASEELELSAKLNVNFIQNWFSYRFSDLSTVAEDKNNVELLELLVKDLKESGKTTNQYVKSDEWLHLVTSQQNTLINFSQNYDYIYDLFLIDNQGNVLYTVAGESDLGTNLFDGPLAYTLFSSSARESLESNQVLFSDLEHYEPSNNFISGFLTAPLKDRSGKNIGIFAIQVRLDKLFDLFHNDSSSSVKHYLVGEDGILRTPISNNKDEVLNRVISTVQYQTWHAKNSNQNPTVKNGEGNAFDYMGPENKRVIGLHNTVQVANTKWVLISEVDQDIALSSANWLGQIVMLLVFLTGLLVVIIAIYQSRRITRPIIKLAEASMAVAAGEKEQQVEVGVNNEIGRLAEAFNHMLLMRQVHEQALEQSHKESQQALANLADQRFALDQHAIVTITDVDGIITYANDNFAKASGYSIDELIGHTHQLVKSDYHDAEFFDDLYKTIVNGDVWHGEICNKTKNGKLYWNDTTIVPFMDKKGKPQSYIAMRTDVTKRKEAELATQQTLTLLEATLESTDNGILVTSIDGKALQTNSRFAELWKIPPELISSGDEKAMLQHVTQQLANPKQFIEGVEKLRNEKEEVFDTLDFADGRVFERISRPMVHEGKTQGRVWSFRDITKRVQTEKTLLDAKNAAEAAVEAKGEFLASMSHEIRTPMNGVLGMLGLLINSSLSDKQRHKARLAQSSAQSLLALINDILDFSKVDAGKIELELMDFNLRTLLGDFAEAMSLKAQEKNIELVLDVTRIELSSIKGDPGRLRQILTNIVGNAIKFTESGEIVIRAGLHEGVNNRVIFYCSITDSGIGIPKDKLPTLFDAFTQVDASTTRKYGGTGLGLSIVKKLCEIMGGSISVMSEPRKGTRFEFTLTFESSEHSVPVVPPVSISGLTILVVDDNETNRTVLVNQLEHWGATVVGAKKGTDALDYLNHLIDQPNSRPVDIALIDMQMPSMNGAALGQAIRNYKHFDAMKLVMMTSMGHKGDANYFASLGFNASFPKPATTADLFNALSVASNSTSQATTSFVTHHYLKTLDYDQPTGAHQTEALTPKIEWPSNTRLLLVEDNHVNQEVALGVLDSIGLHADVAGDGVEALYSLNDAPKENPYTLILMDCQMPEMDGYEASQCIRAGEAGERNVSIPIIAMTANAMKGDKEKCLKAGMSDYLSKPIDPDALYSMMEKWLIAPSEKELLATHVVDSTISIDPPINTHQEINAHQEKVDIDSSSIKVWDQAAALRRLGGKEKLLNKLLVLFLSEAEDRVTELQQAVNTKDIENTRILAHTIKGSAANISALQLQNVASKLEQAAVSADASKFNELNTKLNQAFESLKIHLSQYQSQVGDHSL